MNKIWLIIQREYTSRVRTKSFIVSTLLVPLAFIAIMVASVAVAIYGSEKLVIAVKDESGLFENKFRGLDQGESLMFQYKKTLTLEALREDLEEDEYSGVLYIPDIDLDQPRGIKFYGKNQIGLQTESLISNALTDVIKSEVLKREGYDDELLKRVEEKVSFETIINEVDKSGTSGVSYGFGYVMGFAMYMFIFIYGAMVMKGVAEEKTNRIVEVMLSSIKPIELLVGKVLGIGLVAFTQTLLWGITITGVYMVLSLIFIGQLQELADMQSQAANTDANEAMIIEAIEALKTMDLNRMTLGFLFYFVFGFLFYGAQFAAVGAAVTDDTDVNSYTMPIAMPIIISIIIMNVAVQQPSSSVAVWSSMIPWFSPVVMLARIPFDISYTEQFISMIILVISSGFMLWLAARIYRIGILIQGQKVSFKDIGKWIFMKQ